MENRKKKLEVTLIKNFCFFSIVIVIIFAIVASVISVFNNSKIVNTLEEKYIVSCEGKSRYEDIDISELKRNGAWFEILNTDYERQYPRAEYKKYTSIEIIDIVNGNYEIDGKKYRGIVKKFYDEQNRQRIQVTFFPIDFLRVTPTINIPLEAESIHFLGIYIVGIILFGIGYCLTVFCVSKKIKVELTKPINLLKEAIDDLVVYADPEKLARVFSNLLKNAAAYSYPNTEIIITAKRCGNSVQINFENHGRTIEPEQISGIFEKFNRLDEARLSDTGGAGLGLSIAEEIIRLHGGTITAFSENEMVSFVIMLPISD